MGISARSLRAACLQVLGMSAVQYLCLRRLKQVRQALRHAGSAPEAVRDIISQYGFADFRQFANAYRKAFGEKPPDGAGHESSDARQRRFLIF
jgi:AraC-like DNA-binding protein